MNGHADGDVLGALGTLFNYDSLAFSYHAATLI